MRNFTLIGFPLRGKLSPKATDEGRRCLYNPSKGYCKNFAPHPASGGASATFPRGGRLYGKEYPMELNIDTGV